MMTIISQYREKALLELSDANSEAVVGGYWQGSRKYAA
jgi:hypothetical protein